MPDDLDQLTPEALTEIQHRAIPTKEEAARALLGVTESLGEGSYVGDWMRTGHIEPSEIAPVVAGGMLSIGARGLGRGAAALGRAAEAGESALAKAAGTTALRFGEATPSPELRSAYAIGLKTREAQSNWSRQNSPTGSFYNDWAYGHIPELSERDLDKVVHIEENDPAARGFYEAARRGLPEPIWTTGSRFGEAPSSGVSRNYRSSEAELGVSMASVDHPGFENYTWADMGGNRQRPVHQYAGWLLPFKGSDDEPLMVGLSKASGAKALAAEESALMRGGTTALQDVFAHRYPEPGPPRLVERVPDPKRPGKFKAGEEIAGLSYEEGEALRAEGKAFWERGESQESKELLKMRKAAQKDIDAGNYKPYFDVAKREDVKASDYPVGNDPNEAYTTTRGQVPSTKGKVGEKTTKKYFEHAENPEATARLEKAYEHGLTIPNSANWYFMRQLQKEFIKHLGSVEGRRQFDQRFASPMAATTGGSDPTANLMTAYWANWVTGKGKALPHGQYERAAQIPSPVGGQYLEGNIEQYDKMLREGITPANPKRWNFRWDFLGEKGPTIDTQISQLFDPKMKMPEFYGPYQQALEKLAAKHGVDPRYFQEVAWSGVKAMNDPKYKVAKPMIQVVNEAIERTARITGLPPDQVVRDALVYAKMPLYGAVGVVAADQIAGQITQSVRNETVGNDGQ